MPSGKESAMGDGDIIALFFFFFWMLFVLMIGLTSG